MSDGNEVAKRIDAFYTKNGRLPLSLQEVGIKEQLEGPIFYQMTDSVDYELWFGTSLGESKVYDSKSRKWR